MYTYVIIKINSFSSVTTKCPWLLGNISYWAVVPDH